MGARAALELAAGFNQLKAFVCEQTVAAVDAEVPPQAEQPTEPEQLPVLEEEEESASEKEETTSEKTEEVSVDLSEEISEAVASEPTNEPEIISVDVGASVEETET